MLWLTFGAKDIEVSQKESLPDFSYCWCSKTIMTQKHVICKNIQVTQNSHKLQTRPEERGGICLLNSTNPLNLQIIPLVQPPDCPACFWLAASSFTFTISNYLLWKNRAYAAFKHTFHSSQTNPTYIKIACQINFIQQSKALHTTMFCTA